MDYGNLNENCYSQDKHHNGMQAELIYRKPSTMTSSSNQCGFYHPGSQKRENNGRDSRETIHSGHFMVSDFEAEAQDDEDELAVPVPEEEAVVKLSIIAPPGFCVDRYDSGGLSSDKTSQQLSIETSLNKLFQCMSLAYRWVPLFLRLFNLIWTNVDYT